MAGEQLRVRGGESENKVTEGKADPVKDSEGNVPGGNVSEGKVTEGQVDEGQADPVTPMPGGEQVVGGGESESRNKLGDAANISSPSSPAPVGALDADVVPGVRVCFILGGGRERGMDLV